MAVAVSYRVSSPVLTAAQAKVRAYARSVATFCQRRRRAVIALAVVAASGAAVSGYFVWRVASEASVAAEKFTLKTGAQATTLYDIHDRQVFTLFTERRIDVPLNRISPHLLAAVLAAEDRRFYEHGGYDLVRLAASGVANLRAGRIVQGGSTITQQLVRITNGDRDKTVTRKFREMLTAAAVERRYSKASILETYLNKVYLGEGFYGVEAAAYGYFGKSASEVTPEEAATIAALIQSPTRYTKQESTARVRARRNWILERMHREHRIDQAAYRAAADGPLRIKASVSASDRAAEPSDSETGTGLYFKEAVRRELIDILPPGSQVLSGGLRVYTTIDPQMQAQAEKALAERLAAMERNDRERGSARQRKLAAQLPPLQGSLVAIDPHTGYVKVLVGGRSFAESPFDRARQARRQPGSAFKPFVYASALESGYAPGSMLKDLDQPVESQEGPYLPGGEHEASQMTVRRALTQSSNRAAVHMLQHVGTYSVLSYAKRFGITSPLPAVPSLALGTGEVSLLELTSAYSVFANKGEHVEPTLIRRVESATGEVLYRARSATRHVVTEDTAYLVTNMLSDVITRGTASNVRRLGFTAPAAGKTGTTDRVADAWFVGYTPRLAAGVWIGYDDPRVIRKGAFANTIAAPVWTSFMKAAVQNGAAAEKFEVPAGLEKIAYCPISGEPAGPYCHLAHEARMRNAIVVTTDPATGMPMATNISAAVQDESIAPPVYYDLARPSEYLQRCTMHTDPGALDARATTSASATSYEVPSYRTTSAPEYRVPAYSTPSTPPPPPQAPAYRVPAVPAYGTATPGVADGVDYRRVTVRAPSQGSNPSQVSPDGRTTVIAQPNGVTRVVVRPMMSPADAADVIRRPERPEQRPERP
jgi:1A family penicillin-binding protein